MQVAASQPSRIQPRRPSYDFREVPRYWLGGNVWGTHMANAINLLFPSGERFFMRSVKAYVDQLDDPRLREQIRGFLAQEALHGAEHEHFFSRLEAQGYELKSFLAFYEHLAWKVLEPRLSPELRLAVTVSLEHFTASFAHHMLTREGIEGVDPTMRALMRWHAAEEIEHKAVAFDVLRAVAPGYRNRALGHLLATAGLLGFWWIGAYRLMQQDPNARWWRLLRDRRRAHRQGDLALGDIARSFLAYLRPDFHPWQVADYALAERELRAQGLAVGAG